MVAGCLLPPCRRIVSSRSLVRFASTVGLKAARCAATRRARPHAAHEGGTSAAPVKSVVASHPSIRAMLPRLLLLPAKTASRGYVSLKQGHEITQLSFEEVANANERGGGEVTSCEEGETGAGAAPTEVIETAGGADLGLERGWRTMCSWWTAGRCWWCLMLKAESQKVNSWRTGCHCRRRFPIESR